LLFREWNGVEFPKLLFIRRFREFQRLIPETTPLRKWGSYFVHDPNE